MGLRFLYLFLLVSSLGVMAGVKSSEWNSKIDESRGELAELTRRREAVQKGIDNLIVQDSWRIERDSKLQRGLSSSSKEQFQNKFFERVNLFVSSRNNASLLRKLGLSDKTFVAFWADKDIIEVLANQEKEDFMALTQEGERRWGKMCEKTLEEMKRKYPPIVKGKKAKITDRKNGHTDEGYVHDVGNGKISIGSKWHSIGDLVDEDQWRIDPSKYDEKIESFTEQAMAKKGLTEVDTIAKTLLEHNYYLNFNSDKLQRIGKYNMFQEEFWYPSREFVNDFIKYDSEIVKFIGDVYVKEGYIYSQNLNEFIPKELNDKYKECQELDSSIVQKNNEILQRQEALKAALKQEESYAKSLNDAESGNASAQYRVYEMLRGGEGCDADPSKAFEWLVLSAKQNYLNALTTLGVFYLTGEQVEKNHQKAAYYFAAASQKGANTQGLLLKCNEEDRQLLKGYMFLLENNLSLGAMQQNPVSHFN